MDTSSSSILGSVIYSINHATKRQIPSLDKDSVMDRNLSVAASKNLKPLCCKNFLLQILFVVSSEFKKWKIVANNELVLCPVHFSCRALTLLLCAGIKTANGRQVSLTFTESDARKDHNLTVQRIKRTKTHTRLFLRANLEL